mmetsp:Transcript_1809/g.2585  ORF Transcript_1809/g.2585 Transcript_1809/m.2585 type:complete len:222 (-) Transcript_1809:1044-1709(-)
MQHHVDKEISDRNSQPLLLLPDRAQNSVQNDSQFDEDECSKIFEPTPRMAGSAGPTQPSNIALLKYFFKLAIPMIISNFAGFLMMPINAALAGRYEDSKALAAVGLGNVYSFIFVISIVSGLNSGQDTLTSQAFGSGNHRLCGVFLNRGALILLTFFIPLAVLPVIFAERIFLFLGQDATVSQLAHSYLQYFLPGLLFFSLFDLLESFLAAMRITFVPMVA